MKLVKIFYVASIVFHREDKINHYPSMTSDSFYSNIDSFLDYCELTVKQNELFTISNVLINCSQCYFYDNHCLRINETKVREFKNWKS